MFADSLFESAPHPAHGAAWSKLASMLLQSFALAVVLAIPLFHLERLQFVPPPPSIQMTSVQQPPAMQQSTSTSPSPVARTEMVQLTFRPHPTTTSREEPVGPPSEWIVPGPPCGANCGVGPYVSDISSAGPTVITLAPPSPPARPPRVSEWQLGEVIHRVLPEYPIPAKQLGMQGKVILMATIGKDGRVENVQPVSGPPLLIRSAMIAVKQWQYRPYLLNQEPVVVQSQITVNFVLNR